MLAAVALSAIMWTWLAASAAADQSPARPSVKYYVVPRSGHGPATLASIAAQTLGNATRFMQIFKLNKGRLQPNGGRLENPKLIEVGWVLELPPDAAGPGVHFGPLPKPNPPKRPTPRPQPRSSPASSPHAAPPSSSSTVGFVLTAIAIVIGGGLAVAGGLVLPRKGRRRLDGLRRKHLAPRRAGPVVAARTAEPVTRQPDMADPALWSWSTGAVSPADWPADHPSRPQQAVDYRGSQQAVGYRDWPPDHPSRPQRAVDYQGWPADYPSRPQETVGYQGRPYHGQPPLPAQAYGAPPVLQPQPQPLPALPEPEPEPWQAGSPWSTDTLRVASLLISEAEAEAIKIRAEATAVREEATAEAAAVREAAEQEAEGLRASIGAMSTELGEVAAFITKRLGLPGTKTAQSIEAPPAEASPAEAPETDPTSAKAAPAKTGPAKTGPAKTTPARKPTKPRKPAKPAKPLKPGQRPRQVRAVRMMVAAYIGLAMIAAVAGTSELFLHGYAFFVFRSAGTGATSSNGLQEDQGPGQPNAPGAHHHATPRQHGAKNHGAKPHKPKPKQHKPKHKPKPHKPKQHNSH